MFNPYWHVKSKHIDVKYHFVKEIISYNKIILKKIPTNYMQANILTKPLEWFRHRSNVFMLTSNSVWGPMFCLRREHTQHQGSASCLCWTKAICGRWSSGTFFAETAVGAPVLTITRYHWYLDMLRTSKYQCPPPPQEDKSLQLNYCPVRSLSTPRTVALHISNVEGGIRDVINLD